MCHKTGRGHDDFSTPEVIRLKPFSGLRWQKPVAILTNRRTYSAANSFVMYLKGLPGVTVVGDREMNVTEEGIEPDVKVDISREDYARDVDTIIETARRLLRAEGERGI